MKFKNPPSNSPEEIARTVNAELQDSVGDAAAGMLEFPDLADDKWAKKIKKARKTVQDLHGWLADELYNDPDTISDLIGDRIHDYVGGDQDEFEEVLVALEKNAHSAMVKACKNLRRK